MKNILKYSLILMFGLALPLFGASAQEISPDPTVEGATTQTTGPIDFQDLKNQPLSVRREIVATELKSILTRLNVLYDKTKLAMDRLNENGIDTTKASIELSLVAESLEKAKKDIDIFSNQSISLSPTEMQPTPLRDAVLKAELSLKESRDHIINTLLLLKAAIPTTVETRN